MGQNDTISKIELIPSSVLSEDNTNLHSSKKGRCCDMGQNDTISKIELIPSSVLSEDNTNCCNDIHKFSQLFDEQRGNRVTT